MHSDSLLYDIARSVSAARSAEELTRNLLAVLETLTGLDSVYLTRVNPEKTTFEVIFARNTEPDSIEVAEGLRLPWQDTVCRRALAEGVRFTHAADAL